MKNIILMDKDLLLAVAQTLDLATEESNKEFIIEIIKESSYAIKEAIEISEKAKEKSESTDRYWATYRSSRSR